MLFYHELFKSIRESKCLTLENIGEKINVSKQTVQKWEKGIAKPRPSNVYALAKILGVSAVDISDLKPEKWLIDSVSQNGNGNVAAVNGSSIVVGQASVADAVESFRIGLIRQLIKSDLPAESLKIVLEIIENYTA